MTDRNIKMPDLSQTIYQLKEEVKRADYIDIDYLDCVDVNVLKDALTLLKAQQPRVMTLEEVLHLKFDDVVFFELSTASVVISAIVIDVIEHMPDGDIGLIQFRHIQEPTNNADLEYYGKTWRCWTSRPDEKRRAETPWTQISGS